jgi:hypothetical protein
MHLLYINNNGSHSRESFVLIGDSVGEEFMQWILLESEETENCGIVKHKISQVPVPLGSGTVIKNHLKSPLQLLGTVVNKTLAMLNGSQG